MTPAQHLRKAAQLARETAEAATPGPWEHDGTWWLEGFEMQVVKQRSTTSFSEGDWVGMTYQSSNAAHIALWSPPVALAVAAWLEAAACNYDVTPDLPSRTAALAVADALLQTQATARRQQEAQP